MRGDKELMGFALAARHMAYAPYSGYQVGAALITDDGQLLRAVTWRMHLMVRPAVRSVLRSLRQ